MDAGLIKEQIQIYHKVETSTSQRGQPLKQPELFMECLGGIVLVDSMETEYASKRVFLNTYSIVIRYNRDFIPNNKMMIKYDGLKLNIISVVPTKNDSIFIRAINKDGEAWPQG